MGTFMHGRKTVRTSDRQTDRQRLTQSERKRDSQRVADRIGGFYKRRVLPSYKVKFEESKEAAILARKSQKKLCSCFIFDDWRSHGAPRRLRRATLVLLAS